MKLQLICAILCLAVSCQAAIKSYEGYKTYRVTANSHKKVASLEYLAEEDGIDFWTNTRVPRKPIDVMVAPSSQKTFEHHLTRHNIHFEVLIGDVETVIEKERQAQKMVPKFNGKISFDRYYRYSEIQDYLAQLQEDYPNLAKVYNIGQTYEGLTHSLIRISSNGGDGSVPAVFIDAGIHAREWAAPALALYIINQLVENYDSNRALVDNLDWYIVPVANPDGYEYTHTDERMWRKTRSTNSGSSCRGSDPNRNYDFHWGEVGASTSPCSETYRGPSPHSEIEVVNMVEFEATLGTRFNGYIALHSYGPYWLYPWGYTSALPSDWRDLDDLANEAADAIRAVRGEDYEVGSSTNVLYAAAGGSDDYAKGVLDSKYAYTVELVGGGSNGFDLPASQIKNVVGEAWEGIQVFGRTVANTKK